MPPDYFTSGMNSLVEFLKGSGNLMDVLSFGGQGMRTGGAFDPQTKQIMLYNADQQRVPDATGRHELVHALQYSNLPNRAAMTAQQIEELKQMPGGQTLAENLVYPSAWTQGHFADPNVIGTTGNLRKMIGDTRQEQENKVPTTPQSPLGQATPVEYMPIERQAYYLTNPAMGIPNWKDLGMYLRNRGIPWDIVDNF